MHPISVLLDEVLDGIIVNSSFLLDPGELIRAGLAETTLLLLSEHPAVHLGVELLHVLFHFLFFGRVLLLEIFKLFVLFGDLLPLIFQVNIHFGISFKNLVDIVCLLVRIHFFEVSKI